MKKLNEKNKGPLGFGALVSYFSLLKDQKKDLALVLFLMLFSTAVSLVIPLYAGKFVDAISDTAVNVSLGTYLVGSFFFQVTSARLGLRTVTRLRRKLFAHML